MPSMIDIKNQEFGSLRVIERVQYTEGIVGDGYRKSALWRCRCACGRDIVVAQVRLKRGMKHCGCMGTERKRPDYRLKPRRRCTEQEIKAPMKPDDGTGSTIRGLGVEFSCPRCGKLFLCTTGEWAYRYREKKYCSWPCLQAARRKQ